MAANDELLEIIKGTSKKPFLEKAAMHVIYCVNVPRSASARLRKVSLQTPYLSAFSLIKWVFRDALKKSHKIKCKFSFCSVGGDTHN